MKNHKFKVGDQVTLDPKFYLDSDLDPKCYLDSQSVGKIFHIQKSLFGGDIYVATVGFDELYNAVYCNTEQLIKYDEDLINLFDISFDHLCEILKNPVKVMKWMDGNPVALPFFNYNPEDDKEDLFTLRFTDPSGVDQSIDHIIFNEFNIMRYGIKLNSRLNTVTIYDVEGIPRDLKFFTPLEFQLK